MQALIVVLLIGVGLIGVLAVYQMMAIQEAMKRIDRNTGRTAASLNSITSTGYLTSIIEGLERRLMRIEDKMSKIDQVASNVTEHTAYLRGMREQDVKKLVKIADVTNSSNTAIYDKLTDLYNMLDSTLLAEEIESYKAMLTYTKVSPMFHEQDLPLSTIAKKVGVKKEEIATIIAVCDEKEGNKIVKPNNEE